MPICNKIINKYRDGTKITTFYSNARELVIVTIPALIEKIESYDPYLGYAFSTHAWKRIYGDVIDELRKEEILPSRHKKHKLIKEVSLDTSPYNKLASLLGVPTEELKESYILSLMKGMNPRARIVLEAYLEGKLYKSIRSKIGGVTISRCSQLKKDATDYLRGRLIREGVL